MPDRNPTAVLNLAINYEEPFLQEGEEDQRVIFMGEILSREEEQEGGASNMEQALNLTLGSGSFLQKFYFLCQLRALFIFKRVGIICEKIILFLLSFQIRMKYITSDEVMYFIRIF
jgi:hypothetical protein